jgi:hypothetical protein
MIALTEIVPDNIYSQHDAAALLGAGFTDDAAREALLEACRSGELESRQWRRRYWFTGRSFLAWVATWFGVLPGDNPAGDCVSIAPGLSLLHNGAANPEPVAKRRRGGGR